VNLISAMFCSGKCQEKAKKEFHQFECNVSGNPDLNFSYYLRAVVKCLRVFDYNVDELKKFLELNKKIITVFDFDSSDPNDPSYEKNMILSTFSVQNSVLPMKLGMNMVLLESNRFISCHPKLKELWKKHGTFLNGLLEKSFACFFISCIGAWFSKDVNIAVDSIQNEFLKKQNSFPMRPGMRQENVGQGVFPFFSSLNSSCDRNVVNVSVGNKMIMYICRPIKSGSQLFRMYSEPFYNLGPAAVRRVQVKQTAGIWCDCEACKNDWPTYEGLRAVDPFFQYENARSFSTHEVAMKTVERNNAYLDKNFVENKPTQEVYITIDNNVFELNGLTRSSFYP
jgi:SET domain